MIRLNHTSLHKMKLHAMTTYPEECCGVMLGKKNGSATACFDIMEIKNTQNENRTHRFLITPQDYRQAEEEASKEGVEIVGFYHSHPDHPAEPSRFDLEHAFPWWSYVIVSVVEKLPSAVRSWLMREDRSAFDEEEIQIVDGPFRHPQTK